MVVKAQGTAWLIRSRYANSKRLCAAFRQGLRSVGTGIAAATGFSDQWGNDADRGFESRIFRATARAILTATEGLGGALGGRAVMCFVSCRHGCMRSIGGYIGVDSATGLQIGPSEPLTDFRNWLSAWLS